MRSEKNETRECIALIGSVTQAMHAQTVLAQAAIRSEVIKADSAAAAGRGCVYALVFPCSMETTVKTVLRNAGIRARMK